MVVFVIGIVFSLSPAAIGAVAFVAVFVAVLPVLLAKPRDTERGGQ